MVACTFDFSAVAFGRRIIEHQPDGRCYGDDGGKLSRNDIEHLIGELLVVFSDVGHVVEYLSVVIAEMAGLYPLSDGSPSVKGEQYAEDKLQEIDFCFRFQTCGELVGDDLKKSNGVLLSWRNHGSPFWVKVLFFKQYLYHKRRLLVKANLEENFWKGQVIPRLNLVQSLVVKKLPKLP